MHEVIIIPESVETFDITSDSGAYQGGMWVKNPVNVTDVPGAIFPVTGNDIRNYAEGTLTLKDYKLYTNVNLLSNKDEKGTQITRKSTSEEFQVVAHRSFEPSSNLHVYFLRALRR